MSILKKILAGVSAFAVALSLTACADTKWASKIDGTEIRAGIYIFYTIDGYSEASTKLNELEKTGDFFSQTLDEKDMRTYIKDYATNKCLRYIAIEKKFDELGLVLSDTDIKTINYNIETDWDQVEKIYTQNGVSKQSYTDVYTNSYKELLIFDKYYEADGIESISDDELKDYYAENNARVKYIPFTLKDKEGNLLKDADKAKVIKMAEEYLARAKSGTDFATLMDEYYDYYVALMTDSSSVADSTNDSSSVIVTDTVSDEISTANAATTQITTTENADETSLVDESSEEYSTVSSDSSITDSTVSDSTVDDSSTTDSSSVTDPYLYESILNIDATSPTTKFIKNVFENAKVGVPILFEDDESYYLVIRYDLLERADLFTDNRTALLHKLKDDDFNIIVDSWALPLSIEKNMDSYKRYNPDKLKFD